MAINSFQSSTSSYVSVKVGKKLIHGLLDTGAAISVCTSKILPKNAKIEKTNLSLRGVTGNNLQILGTAYIQLDFGPCTISQQICVVEKLNGNSLIIGRDLITENKCIIDYAALTISIRGTIIPLLKTTKIPRKPVIIAAQKTVIIPPKSVKIMTCELLHGYAYDNKQSTHDCRLRVSTSGVAQTTNNINEKHDFTDTDLLLNFKKGKSKIPVRNITNQYIRIFRRKKLAKFVPIDNHTIQYLNHKEISGINNFEQVSYPTEQDQKFANRWTGCVDKLHKALKIDELTHLSTAEQNQIKELVSEYKNIFAESENDMSYTTLMDHDIILDTDIPIQDGARSIPLNLQPIAEKEIQKLMDQKIIQPSDSPYHSPAFLVKKPGGPGYRLVSDFRNLNEHVIRSSQSLPDIEQMLAQWSGCTLFCKLDFLRSFYQARLTEKSRKYTSSSIKGVGPLFEYLRLPCGISSAPGFFQSLVEKTFLGLKGSVVQTYIDDCLTAHRTFQGMINNLRLIFERIAKANLLLRTDKCSIFQESVKFLGYIVNKDGLAVNHEKIEAITKMLPPKNVKGIKSYLGMTGYFRKFIKDYATIAEPLTRLLKKSVKFKWGKDQQQAWQTLNNKLTHSPILRHPILSKDFTLVTDCSSYCAGAVLMQSGDDGQLHPVSYSSKILTPAQQKYSAFERELLALKIFCEKYRIYLINKEFTVIVDNSALLHLNKIRNIEHSPKLWRWFQQLSQYKFTVIHRPGKDNPADGVSRLVRNNDVRLAQLPKTSEVDAPSVLQLQEEVHLEPQEEQSKRITSSNSNEAVPVIVNVNEIMVECTDSTVKEEQQKDPTLSLVFKWLEVGQKPSRCNDLSPEAYTYHNSFARLKLKDGLIYRSWEKISSEDPTDLLCIPTSLQNKVIGLCHEIPMSGHYGAEKTISRIQSRYYFVKMKEKVELYIDNCHPCFKRRTPNKKPRATLTPYNGTGPNHIIAIDIMENCPPVQGYHAILVIMDRFTCWAEAIPLRRTRAEEVAAALINTWITRYGIPQQIHSDKAPAFETSALIKSLYQLMGITKTVNTSYRAMENGGCERMIKTLKNLLFKYCQTKPKRWLELLNTIMFAYRTAIHSTTKYSPFWLTFGRVPRLPVDVMMGTLAQTQEFQNIGEYAFNLYHDLRETYSFVHENLKCAQRSMKKRYDKNANIVTYKEGDYVYLWRATPPDISYKKYYCNWKGPYLIAKQLTAHKYKILLDAKKDKYDIVHFEKLKLAKAPGQKDMEQPALEPPSTQYDNYNPLIETAVGPEEPVRQSTRQRTQVNRYQAGFSIDQD